MNIEELEQDNEILRLIIKDIGGGWVDLQVLIEDPDNSGCYLVLGTRIMAEGDIFITKWVQVINDSDTQLIVIGESVLW